MKKQSNVPFLRYLVWGYVLELGVACGPEAPVDMTTGETSSGTAMPTSTGASSSGDTAPTTTGSSSMGEVSSTSSGASTSTSSTSSTGEPSDECGACPCPTGAMCVEGNACASFCSLDVQHIPQGNPCAHLGLDSICVIQPGTPSEDVGVCRGLDGVPLCTPPGDT